MAVGPADVAGFDLIFLLLVAVFTLYLLEDPKIEIPVAKPLLAVSLLYFGLAILLPVAGVVVYDHPVGYIVGDVRWLQILFTGVVIVSVYAGSRSTMVRDLESAFKIVLAFHLVFFLLQLSHYLEFFDTSRVLEFWYHNRSRYGDYGYHIGRFAGASAHSSSLGLSTAMAIAIFGRSFIADRKNGLFLVLAFFLLLASGHRTSMVAVAGIILLFGAYVLAFRGLSREAVRRSAAASTLALPMLAVVYYFNIGRVATSDRYRELLDIFFGRAAWDEISGRAARWEPALERTAEYPIGTLSNAAHVFGDLEAIDSYFVLAYLQGGPVFLASFLALLCGVAITALRPLGSENRSLLPLSMVGIAVAFSLTSNFVTSLPGKAVIVLSVVVAMLVLFPSSNQSS